MFPGEDLMNRARFTFAATLVGASFLATALRLRLNRRRR